MKKHIHFMGIGGSGISAAAAISAASGHKISGCDLNSDSQYLCDLQSKYDFSFNQRHDPTHLNDVDVLVITPAILSLDPQNEELQQAKKKKIPVLTWEEFTGQYLQENKFVIAVAGTHGKSTTTAMIGLILEEAGLDPTVIVGATIPRWGTNFRIGKSKYFVCEADEFNDNFLNYHPDIIVITNIEFDHPEYFKNFDAVKKSLNQFIKNLKSGGTVIKDASLVKDLKLQIPGDFNLQNASLAYQAGIKLGVQPLIIKKSLESFSGVKRRAELKGETKGVKIFDDYGHHPTAIKVTADAFRKKFPDKKIWVVYQPHMFSRTKILFDDFVKVFRNIPADEIIISDIFPSREKDTGLISSRDLVNAIAKTNVRYIGKIEDAAKYLQKNVGCDDIVINMGAGDIYKLSEILLNNSEESIDCHSGKRSASRIYFSKNVPLAPLTTFKIGGPAKLFFKAQTKEEVIKVVVWARENKIPYFVLGGGSNILISDSGFDGLVIKMDNGQPASSADRWKRDNEKITVGAGASLPWLVNQTAKQGLSGLEFCAGIPGTIGGAIMGNAGTKDKWIGELVEEVEILDQDGKIKIVKKKDCEFTYRTSRFKKSEEIILRATLNFEKDRPENIKKRIGKYLEKRQNQPTLPSAGSIFKNPKDVSAGELIEKCGLKGQKIGNAQISSQHANFIVNLGGAKAQDVLQLIKLIKNQVKEKFNIKLEEEIVYLGNFSKGV